MVDKFPSPPERTVASALLLLSGTMSDSDEEPSRESESLSLISSGSKSYSSSLTTEISSSAGNFGIVEPMNFKVARKSRSKQIWRSDSSVEPAAKPLRSDSTEVSCLSMSAKAISSGSSCPNRDHERKTQTWNNRPRCGSNHINRRAQAILELLSVAGSLSEVKIRQELGDSPDTSKALRILLRCNEVKRSGAGGRLDPYVYMELHTYKCCCDLTCLLVTDCMKKKTRFLKVLNKLKKF